MNLYQSPYSRARCLALWLVVAGCLAGRTEPFVPRDGQQVLERLRNSAFDPAARELRELRARLATNPQDLGLASQFAWKCLERGRAEADPRYLGRAESALAPWWHSPRPPLEALVLRATLRQSQHDFTNALADLNLALDLAPGNAQAWLTRATVLTVLGRYAEARRACIRLVGRAPELTAITAAAGIGSLSGDAARSYELLRRTLAGHHSASVPEKLWALTVLAETGARLGHVAEADTAFHQALGLGQRDAYLLGAYADFLLDQERANEVVALLKDETRADSLLLRLALAESRLTPRPSGFTSHAATLRARFEASHLRGDTVHQREEARFTLHLREQPAEALRLAQANWQVQREPADARILLETALAANEPAAADPVLEFLRRTKLEDVALDPLVALLSQSPKAESPRAGRLPLRSPPPAERAANPTWSTSPSPAAAELSENVKP